MSAQRFTPAAVFSTCLVVVALITPVLFSVHGYGTALLQLVVLGGWGIVAAASSGEFADHHYWLVMVSATIINVVLFAVPAGVVVALARRRSAAFANWAAVAILCFYALCLFVFFPATDGP